MAEWHIILLARVRQCHPCVHGRSSGETPAVDEQADPPQLVPGSGAQQSQRDHGHGVLASVGLRAGRNDHHVEKVSADLIAQPEQMANVVEERGGAFYSEAAAQLMASLHAGTGDVRVVNVRNAGALPDLPADDVVEVPARIDRDGAHPLGLEPLAPEMRALVQHSKAYERLALGAATSGNRVTALRALLSNPLVAQWAVAEPLLDALLEANRAHLPRFLPADR